MASFLGAFPHLFC